MAQLTRTGDLTSGPLLKKIILFSLPLAASSILQLLFNAADVVVVGRFAGSTALAAVGSNGALINLLVNLFVGLSLGANVVAARCFGAKDERGVQNTVQTSVTLGLVSGVLLAFVGFFVARGLLELMSCPEDVIDLSTLYLKIYFIGMPMTMLYNFNASLLRAVGDTRRPLYFLIIACLVNIALDVVLVAVLGMGVGREWVGDICVMGDTAYIFCLPSVHRHLLSIDKVGRCGGTAENIAPEDVPQAKREVKEKSFSVMSMRLDAVTAGMFDLSRTEAAKEIRLGNVSLNYEPTEKPDAQISAGDIISLRGAGKGSVTGTGGSGVSGTTFFRA